MLEKEIRDSFTWTAFYSDSSELNQVCKCGFKHLYYDIDRDRLAAFGIKKNDELIYRVFLEPNQTLIYRRRPSGDLYTGEIHSELILVGTKQKVKGVDVQNIAYISVPDGLVQTAGKWVGGAPILTKGEKVGNE